MNKICLRIAIFIGFLPIFSCRETQKQENNSVSTEQATQKPSQVFGIEGEDIFLRKGAGTKYEKIINATATSAIGETQYCQIDYTVKVKVLEVANDWSKIEVVEPDWLTSSHKGWIPTKHILKANADKQPLAELDPSEYEIIKTRHNSNVQNFHVLIKRPKFDKDYLHQFTKQFRAKECTMNCNINLYDTKSIVPLIGVYPLEQNQYIQFADHYLAMSSFDAVEVKSWYPYQDFKYKEYGGKNWKKTPIK
jgi:hypothetical protein